MNAAQSASAKLVALIVATGLAVGGVALWSLLRRGATSPGSSPADSAGTPSTRPTDPPGAALNAGAPRDRDMTASPEAFKVYAEGLQLVDRLPVQAAARFREAARIDPRFAAAQYRLAMADVLASRQGEAKEAIQLAGRNQDRLPEPYRSTLEVAARFIDGAFDLAMASMKDALARQPSNADLHYLAGTMAARVCDYFDPNSVIEHYEQVLAVEPEYPGVRPVLMEAYEMKGMHDWLLSRAQENQSRNPQRPEAIAEMGRARITRGEYGDAMEAADEIARRGEDLFALGLAPAFILTGHYEQIASMYDPEMERTNTSQANVLTHLHAGINDVWLGRFARAVTHFERGAEFVPAAWEKSSRARFFLLLGRTQSLVGRTREANAAFEAAQMAAGPQPVLEYALGLNLLAAGSRADAERVVHRLGQESRPSQPGWTEPWRFLMTGEIALAAGDPSRAVDSFREAWRLEEPLALDCIVGHTDAYFLDSLGRGFLALKQPADSLQAFDRIRSLGMKGIHQPEIAVRAQYYSGRALEALGRRSEALARYRQFVKLWGGAETPPPEVADAKARLQGEVGIPAER